MILSDTTILELMDKGELEVEGLGGSKFDKDLQVQPASIDLKIGRNVLELRPNDGGYISLDKPANYDSAEEDEIIIPPKTFLNATTLEYISLPDNLTGFVEGRSSIGRMGLFVENAGWIDPGFKGQITLELYNSNRWPMKIKAGRRICQIVLAETDQDCTNQYNGKYMGQKGATASRAHEDEEI